MHSNHHLVAKLFVLLATLLLTSNAWAEDAWKLSSEKDFCTTFEAGWEADKKPLYVSMAAHGAEGLKESEAKGAEASGGIQVVGDEASVSWHLGKVGAHLISMLYPYGGKEHSTNVYLTFCPKTPEAFAWQDGAKGEFPADAVKGWHASEDQKVCRAEHEGGMHPGKLVPKHGVCYIGFGGKEIAKDAYQVLVHKPTK